MGVSYSQIRDAIRAALNPPNPVTNENTYRYWVRDVYVDGYAIAEDEQAKPGDVGRYIKVEFTINDKDQVVIGTMTKVVEKRTYEAVTESLRLTEAEAVGETGLVWRVTLINPGWSANGFYYSPQVLGAAAALYEGAKGFVNHTSESEMKDRPERDVRDICGWYEGVRQEKDGSLTAEIHLLERYAWLGQDLKQKPSLYGLSHDVRGKTKIGEAAGRSGRIVEAIAQVKSVDVVTEAAAGGAFDQMIASNRQNPETPEEGPDIMEWTTVTLEALRNERPDLVTKIEEAARTAAKSEADTAMQSLRESVSTVSTENKTLRESLAAMRAENVITKKVSASNLPDKAKERVQKLLESGALPLANGALDVATLETRIAEAIQSEQDYLTAIGGTGVKGAGQGTPTTTTIAEAVKNVDAALDSAFGIAAPAKEGN